MLNFFTLKKETSPTGTCLIITQTLKGLCVRFWVWLEKLIQMTLMTRLLKSDLIFLGATCGMKETQSF